jgi:flavodoxin I
MIGLFFGSTNGNTAAVAQMIQEEFAIQAAISVELFDVADYYLEEMLEFDYLILGIPTWDIGQLQRDWEAIIEEFDNVNLQGKRAALFGLGDQIGYPDTFGDAVFFLADKLQSQGATLAGKWPTAGYTFTNSWARVDGSFLGLMLDEDNQSDLTQVRVQTWVRQLIHEFGMGSDAP